jgi:CRISPR-associated protein Cst2
VAFVTGLILIDAPASALNNLGKIEGAMTDNAVGVKHIRTREGAYPYVSAQAFRYWLRRTLETGPWGWIAAPIYREEKVAYTDANPLKWWDDDLFGYMRAGSKKASAQAARGADLTRKGETPTVDTVTRVSPFRVSTLVSVAPLTLTTDFGVMSRHEGDPVPHEHQFYRTTLQGAMSLDLRAAGTFTYRPRTGYLNLDAARVDEARKMGLEEIPEEKAFRLPMAERLGRITALIEGICHLDGGAKQTIHYTDVTPDVLVLAVCRGGNNVFGHIVGADENRHPVLKLEAIKEALDVLGDDILSRVYVGWVQGYLDSQRQKLLSALQPGGLLERWAERFVVGHPRIVTSALVEDLRRNPSWLV